MLIPKSSYRFALRTKDFRLLWALNCGSISLLESIPVYVAETLDSQLNYNMRLSLFTQFEYSPADMAFTAPIVCQWYQQDLIVHSDSRGSKYAMLTTLLPYLGPTEAGAVSALLEKPNRSFTLAFTSFDFRCRLLERQTYHVG
jgi:hypothetical protein